MSKNAVIFYVTRAHFQLTTVAIASILENYHSEDNLKILVVVTNVQQPDIDFIRKMPEIYGKPMVSIDMWAPPAEAKQIDASFTIGEGVPVPPMAVWRLFAPISFPGYDKLLYLDNDVIVHADVNRLFDLLDDQHMIAAVPDFLFATSKDYNGSQTEIMKTYHVKNIRRYFNDGVMIINTKLYNQAVTSAKLLDMINNGHYFLADQTILNMIAGDKLQVLPFRYNYQHGKDWFQEEHHFDPALVKTVLDEYDHIVIRHFAGTGRLTPVYLHVRLVDEWEAEFWRLLYNAKLLSRSFDKNAD